MPHKLPDTVRPKDAIVVAGDEWRDDSVNDLEYDGDLQPGDNEVVARVVSTNPSTKFLARAVATTAHGADIDGDGNVENVVRYHFDMKKSVNDKWSELPGLNTTMPFGRIGNPIELVPGTFIGPMAAFRIRIENRSFDFASPTAVSEDDIGGQIHGQTIRRGRLQRLNEGHNGGGN